MSFMKRDQSHCGVFANVLVLPNVKDSPNTSRNLALGDLAFVPGCGTYQCTDPTMGAAIWSVTGFVYGFLSSLTLSSKQYVQGKEPVEEMVGQFMFDGVKIPPGAQARLSCIMTPQFSTDGEARIKVYDLGPAAGPFKERVEITGEKFSMATRESGLAYRETEPLVLSAAPGEGRIVNAPRLYEAVVIQNSVEGDTVHVGCVALTLEFP